MATLIKSDGTEIPNVDISALKHQQDMVGGYIEYVYFPTNRVAIVNEEGRLIGLPYNEVASIVAGCLLVGDVIIVDTNELN